jgi:hypothetical protein
MVYLLSFLIILAYFLGKYLEREKWVYHNHFLENGVAKRYKKGRIEYL